MNKNEFKRDWNEIKHKIRQKWNKLTDSDISEINGNYDHMISTVQKKHGYSREQAEREYNQWNMGAQQHKGGSGQEKNWKKDEHMGHGKGKKEGPMCEHGKNRESCHQPHRTDNPEKRGWSDEEKKRKAG